MAKKSSIKSSWECKEGCKLGKHPCKHLEKLMNIDPNRGRMTLEYMKQNQDVVMRDEPEPETYNFIESKLRGYGLQEHEIELLLDYYVANLSLREIQKKHGYLNHQYAWRLLQDLSARLKNSPRFKDLLQGKSSK